MKENGSKNRREAGKSPETGRFAGRGERPTGRATGTGKGSEGDVSLRTLDELQAAGLLSGEGKRLREQITGVPAAGPKRFTRAEGSGAGRLTRPDAPTDSRRGTAAAEPGRRPAPPRAKFPARTPDAQGPERLHKVMAQAGLASRRHSEELIQAGRVTVNGQVVTQLGTKVIPGRDLIEIDGRPLGKVEEQVYILLNKPKGFVTTLYDPQGRKKVTDLLGSEVGQRVYPVGRLDYDTEGLLLLTNDGELANALMHPAHQIKKTYMAKVRGVPNPGKITQLEQGIELDDGMTAPADVKLVDVHGPNAASLSIRIHEGRNRQVRRMFDAVGHEVIHLKRTTLGPLHLRTLELGNWRYLTPQELMDLRASVGDRTGARGAFVAEMGAIRKGQGRRITRDEGSSAGERPAGRLRSVHGSTQPVRGTTQPVTDGTRPVLGRPQRVAGYARPEGTGERRPFDREGGGKPRFDREGGAKPRFDREGGGKPRFDREGGPRPAFGRDAGPKPRVEGEGGPKPGKAYARPSGDFNPRPGALGTGTPKPRHGRREGGERPFSRPDREGGQKARTGPQGGPKRRP